jgi:hypothetical protein
MFAPEPMPADDEVTYSTGFQKNGSMRARRSEPARTIAPFGYLTPQGEFGDAERGSPAPLHTAARAAPGSRAGAPPLDRRRDGARLRRAAQAGRAAWHALPEGDLDGRFGRRASLPSTRPAAALSAESRTDVLLGQDSTGKRRWRARCWSASSGWTERRRRMSCWGLPTADHDRAHHVPSPGQ